MAKEIEKINNVLGQLQKQIRFLLKRSGNLKRKSNESKVSSMVKVKEIVNRFYRFAPRFIAEPNDPVGLQLGDMEHEVKR